MATESVINRSPFASSRYQPFVATDVAFAAFAEEIPGVHEVDVPVLVHVERGGLRGNRSEKDGRAAARSRVDAAARVDAEKDPSRLDVDHVEPVSAPVQPLPVESAAEDCDVVVLGDRERSGRIAAVGHT